MTLKSEEFVMVARSIFVKTVSAALILSGVLSVVFGIWICFKYRISVPFRDMIEVMAWLDTNPSMWRGDHFTQFHSMQHRPALAALLWHLDRFLTGSSGFIPLALSHIALVTSTIITVTRWSPRPSTNHIDSWIVPIAATALMLSLSNWINLVWEMQLHLSLSFLFIVASAYCATNVWQPNKANHNSFNQKYLCLSILYGTCAAFSFGYGLVILPVILIHALLSGWPKKALLQVAIAVFALFFMYFILLPREESPAAHLNLQLPDIAALFAYMSAILLGPLSGIQLHALLAIDRVLLTSSAGVIVLFLYASGCLNFYISASPFSPKRTYIGQSFSVVITSSAVACALITAVSRPIDTQGFVARYYIVGSLFFLALPGLYVQAQSNLIDHASRRRVMNYIAGFFLILSFSGHFNNYERPLRKWHDATLAAVAADMEIYVEDGNALMGPSLHQWQQTTLEVWEIHAKRISTQRKESSPYSWIGRSLTNLFQIVSSDDCSGNVSGVAIIDDSTNALFFLASAKFNVQKHSHAEWVIVADSNGVISGIGVPGYPVKTASPQGTQESLVWPENNIDLLNGFRGFLKVDIALQLYFYVARDRQACSFDALDYTRYTGRSK